MIMITFKGAIWDFLQSPDCSTNHLQHVCTSGLGSIMSKSCATHRALMRNISYYMPCGMKEQLSCWVWQSWNHIYLSYIGWTIDLSYIGWTIYLSYIGYIDRWMRGVGTGVPGENPWWQASEHFEVKILKWKMTTVFDICQLNGKPPLIWLVGNQTEIWQLFWLVGNQAEIWQLFWLVGNQRKLWQLFWVVGNQTEIWQLFWLVGNQTEIWQLFWLVGNQTEIWQLFWLVGNQTEIWQLFWLVGNQTEIWELFWLTGNQLFTKWKYDSCFG